MTDNNNQSDAFNETIENDFTMTIDMEFIDILKADVIYDEWRKENKWIS